MTKHDSQPTKRQEWREFSTEIQENVNQTLEELSVEIEAANLLLVNKYQSDPEAAGSAVEDVIEYLDDYWGCSGDVFHITGKWYEPTIGMNEEGIIVRQTEAEAFHSARSNGFMVKIIEDKSGDERPVIGMSFIVSSTNISNVNLQGHFDILAFAELKDISLQYMRPSDTEVVSSELDEVGTQLMRADSLMWLYMNNEHSSFYRQSAKRQERFIRSIIDSIDEVMPAPDSLDKLLVHDAESPIIYMKNPNGSGVIHIQTRDDSTKFKITGHVLGATVHDIIQDGFGKKYSSPDDIAASGAGLSLIISPREMNFDLPNYNGENLLVPIRAIDSLKLSME